MNKDQTNINTDNKGGDVEVSFRGKNVLMQVIRIISILMCAFHIYTAATISLKPMNQRGIHLAFALVLLFLYEASKCKSGFLRLVNLALAVFGGVCAVYIVLNWQGAISRITKLYPQDIFFGIAIMILVVYIAARSIGIWMPLIAVFFVAYCWFGQNLQGSLRVPPLSISRFVSYISLGTEGIYGSALSASATLVFMFVLFAEFLVQLGAGDFIIQLAQALMGSVRGGPAKIAVVASALFGSVSGSPAANVAGTGALTIPMMKKMNFNKEFAGGVEAAASTGGALLPPVMGSVAFIMAENIGVKYSAICIAAFVPAILYYLGVFTMVDLESAKKGLRGMSKEELPNAWEVFKDGWHFCFSFFALILFLVILQWSATKAALISTVLMLVAWIVKKTMTHQKIEWGMFLDIAVSTVKTAIPVTAATACAGVVVGALTTTGLSLRLSKILVEASGGQLWLLLILGMVGAIILGMGLPINPVYILLSALVAPAIVSQGVDILSAHLFIMYFGVMASITPPVGMAFYVASGIAGSHPMKTGLIASKLALSGFILPFVFVYNPGLILKGPPLECAVVILTSTIGVIAMSFALQGYIWRNLSIPIRILFGICALLSIIPETLTDIIGVGMFILLLLFEFKRKKSNSDEIELKTE